MKACVLALALLTGCAHWNVTGFGVPLQASDRYQRHEDPGKLTTEEKWGTILLLSLAVGGSIAVGVAASN